MIQRFTAVYKKQGKWYVGWVEEIPGVNTQGTTLKETKENLKDALALMLEVNRVMMQKELTGRVIRESLTLAT